MAVSFFLTGDQVLVDAVPSVVSWELLVGAA
jgi:hypothetical protein